MNQELIKLKKNFSSTEISLMRKVVIGTEALEDYGDLYDKLFQYFSVEMPYGTVKAKTSDPYKWIIDKLSLIL